MGRVLTNNTALSFTVETSLGTAGDTWTSLEPNDIGTYGATTTTVAREPISKDRARRKGTITDLESAVEFESDLTVSAMSDFGEGFVFASSPTAILRFNNTSFANSSDLCSVPALSAAQAGMLTYAAAGAKSLVYLGGYGSFDGVYPLAAQPVTSDTELEIDGTGITTSFSTDPSRSIEVAGVELGASDCTIAVSGSTVTLTSAADVSDFATLGLTAGMMVFIGNRSTTTGSRGFARVVSVASNVVPLDKADATLVAGSGISDISVMFGQLYRNVSTDDASFIERSYQFELAMPNLGAAAATGYEYAKGNFANTLSLNVPLADKATMSFGFVGTDTEVPTTTQKTHTTEVEPSLTEAFNTSSDVLRLRVTDTDETAMTSCFKDFTLSLNNNVSPERCIGTLGAEFMNTGNFLVDLEAEVLFTDEDVVSAIRNNDTVTLDAVIRNNNGAVAVDIPSLTLGDGAKSFPVNESVTISLSGQSFNDATLGTSVGISTIPGAPAA